jgi:hypothetical protein
MMLARVIKLINLMLLKRQEVDLVVLMTMIKVNNIQKKRMMMKTTKTMNPRVKSHTDKQKRALYT